jgi:NAD(P)-dependent dehydrogenase (short-subunit alcohol dehydrogenase family)
VSEIISAGGKAIFVKSACSTIHRPSPRVQRFTAPLAVDVTSAEAWKTGVERVVQTFGGLNFVVNNAGGW